MHYLTTYYKNLCNQLQEKVNVLNAQLNEGQFDITYIKPKPSRKSFFEPGAAKDYFTPNTPDSRGTEWSPKPWLSPDYVPPKYNPDARKNWLDTNAIKTPDRLFKQKERSPYIQRYGNPDAIDIMPEERRDMISSIKREDHPLANLNNDLNLLRDKTVGQSRNTFDYNEIKNKFSRMSKNI